MNEIIPSRKSAAKTLAINGGRPSAREPWPAWPTAGSFGRTEVESVLGSYAWAITSPSRGNHLQAHAFREEFASYYNRSWCVETDHGSSALVCALEALGIGPGDEVIVPDLTWVACATVVHQVGATPVLVDVDANTLALSRETVEPYITRDTKAIMVVHLACSAADIQDLSLLASHHHIPIIEDCAQVHGAEWADGSKIGSVGVLAAFSFQNGKPHSAGEGGAVIGDDPELRLRVESARADARHLVSGRIPPGELYVRPTGGLMGTNYCMPEISIALARDGLRRLDVETQRRHDAAEYLDSLLRRLGIRTITANPRLKRRGIYEYGIYLDHPDLTDNKDWLRAALAAELQFPVGIMDEPIHISPLYKPQSKPRYSAGRLQDHFPVSEYAHLNLAMLHHSILLAPKRRMLEVAAAAEKILTASADTKEIE